MRPHTAGTERGRDPGCDGESACRRDSVREPVLPTPWMAIHLCGLPGSVCGRDALSLHGLAPGGVYLATPVARGAGALLPHRFTLTRPVPPEPGRRFVFCGTFLRVASTGASQHPSLRSPDLPRHSELRRGHPTGSPSPPQSAPTNARLSRHIRAGLHGDDAQRARRRAPRRVVRTGSPCDLR